MKKQLLFTFILSAFISQAQQPVVFCPPGAKWHYNFYRYNIVDYPNNPHYVKYLYNKTIENIGDTIIDNEPVKILHQDQFNRGSCSGCYAKRTFVKQHGDTIFIKNSCLSSWQILYNFAANAGEEWTSFSNTVVDSVTTVTINGLILKQLHITWFSSAVYTVTETITERVGGAYLFPLNSGDCDGDNFNNFLCYQDSAFGLYQESEKPCDYTYSPPVGIKELTSDDLQFTIYPNPVRGTLNVELEIKNEELEIRIVDVLGKEMINEKLKIRNGAAQLDVSQLKAGVYFLQVFEKGKLMATQKVIKE